MAALFFVSKKKNTGAPCAVMTRNGTVWRRTVLFFMELQKGENIGTNTCGSFDVCL